MSLALLSERCGVSCEFAFPVPRTPRQVLKCVWMVEDEDLENTLHSAHTQSLVASFVRDIFDTHFDYLPASPAAIAGQQRKRAKGKQVAQQQQRREHQSRLSARNQGEETYTWQVVQQGRPFESGSAVVVKQGDVKYSYAFRPLDDNDVAVPVPDPRLLPPERPYALYASGPDKHKRDVNINSGGDDDDDDDDDDVMYSSEEWIHDRLTYLPWMLVIRWGALASATNAEERAMSGAQQRSLLQWVAQQRV